MANVTTVSGSTIKIDPDGATEWVWSTDLDTGLVQAGSICLRSIQVIPTATNDRVIIHDGGLNTAPLFDTGLLADAYDVRIVYFVPPRWCKPYIDASDCTWPAVTTTSINMVLA
jgi:hypothetical protein